MHTFLESGQDGVKDMVQYSWFSLVLDKLLKFRLMLGNEILPPLNKNHLSLSPSLSVSLSLSLSLSLSWEEEESDYFRTWYLHVGYAISISPRAPADIRYQNQKNEATVEGREKVTFLNVCVIKEEKSRKR